MPDERQQKFANQIQQLQSQMKQLQEKYQQIQTAIQQVESTREGLRTLSKADEQEAMTPVGAGVYMNSTVKETGKSLVEIGADVVVEKDTTDAINFLGDRKDELMEARKQHQQQIQQIQNKYKQFVSQIKQQQQAQNVQ